MKYKTILKCSSKYDNKKSDCLRSIDDWWLSETRGHDMILDEIDRSMDR